MAEFNQGAIVGRVFNADTGEPMSHSMVSMGQVVKEGIDPITLYTTTGREVKSISFPPTYTDDDGYFGIVFQWDPSDIGGVMDATGIDRLEYKVTVWRDVDGWRVPSRTKGTLKLRVHGNKLVGAVGLPTDNRAWAQFFALGVYKAIEKISYGAPKMGQGKTTELYYLVDIKPQLFAYASAS